MKSCYKEIIVTTIYPIFSKKGKSEFPGSLFFIDCNKLIIIKHIEPFFLCPLMMKLVSCFKLNIKGCVEGWGFNSYNSLMNCYIVNYPRFPVKYIPFSISSYGFTATSKRIRKFNLNFPQQFIVKICGRFLSNISFKIYPA